MPLTDKTYYDQIHRIENAYLYEINDAAVESWKSELEHEGITDSDLSKGIDYILNNPGKFINRPHLGNLLEYCGNARSERLQHEANETKAQGYVELSQVRGSTDHGERALKLIKLILKGYYVKDGETIRLTKEDKVNYMLKMRDYYPQYGWEKEAMSLRKDFNI